VTAPNFWQYLKGRRIFVLKINYHLCKKKQLFLVWFEIGNSKIKYWQKLPLSCISYRAKISVFLLSEGEFEIRIMLVRRLRNDFGNY